MTYRQKSCQYCGTTHKKRGPYCSKTCSNKARTLSDTTKAKISHSQSAQLTTPEGRDRNWHRTEAFVLEKKRERAINPDDMVTDPEELYLPPIKTDQPDGTFVAGGDLWRETD